MALDRSQVFEQLACATEEIEVAGIGKLMVRSLSQREAGHVRKLATSEDPEVRYQIAAYCVSRCVLSVDGARMFTDDEVEKLLDTDSDALSAIALGIQKVSKIRPEEIAAEGEASAATSGLASS